MKLICAGSVLLCGLVVGGWMLERPVANATECEGICEETCGWFNTPTCVQANAQGVWGATLTYSWCFAGIPDVGYVTFLSGSSSNVIVDDPADISPSYFFPQGTGLGCSDDIQIVISGAGLSTTTSNGTAVFEGELYAYENGGEYCSVNKTLTVKCSTCGNCN